MLIEQQITERRERAAGAIAKILKRPTGAPYGDYSVKSASGKTYRLAMRGPGLFENYCSCPDFRVNTLGTCKHIEALLLRLRRRHGAALDRKGYARILDAAKYTSHSVTAGCFSRAARAAAASNNVMAMSGSGPARVNERATAASTTGASIATR